MLVTKMLVTRACYLCEQNSLLFQIYGFYFVFVIDNSLWFVEGILNVYLSFERFSMLKNKTNNFFYKLQIKSLYIVSCLLSFLVMVPDCIGYTINYSNELNNYYLSLTTFGKSKAYNIYKLCLFGFFYLWQIASLIFMNKLNIKAYKLFLKKKQKTKANKKSEIVFTKMVITSTISNTTILILNSISFVLRRFLIPNALINVIQNTSILLILIYFLMQIFIFILMDKNVTKELRIFFKLKS
jgi:hypothetical protein